MSKRIGTDSILQLLQPPLIEEKTAQENGCKSDFLHFSQNNCTSIRNLCILAHVDHGKTSLADSLVSSNGIISSKVAGKVRYMDYKIEEQQRGITMKSSAISLLFTREKRRGKEIKNNQDPLKLKGDENMTHNLQEYVVNLIDSPGHIDFSYDVSTATRLSDGAIIVIDILEGVCTQTIAVIRKAWVEKMTPVLVINKVDKLILELQYTPVEAYEHILRLIENVNAITASFVQAERYRVQELRDEQYEKMELDKQPLDSKVMQSNESKTSKLSIEAMKQEVNGRESSKKATENDEDEKYFAVLEALWTFHPGKVNVAFASAIHCWAFSLRTFADIWYPKIVEMYSKISASNKKETTNEETSGESMQLPLPIKKVQLLRSLFGDFAFNAKTINILPCKDRAKSMFVTMVLEPIWQLYDAIIIDPNKKKLLHRVSRLGLLNTTIGIDKTTEKGPREMISSSSLSKSEPSNMGTKPRNINVDKLTMRELESKDPKSVLQSVFRRWLPLSQAVLDMCVDNIPSPAESQLKRMSVIWPDIMIERGKATLTVDDAMKKSSCVTKKKVDKEEEEREIVVNESEEEISHVTEFNKSFSDNSESCNKNEDRDDIDFEYVIHRIEKVKESITSCKSITPFTLLRRGDSSDIDFEIDSQMTTQANSVPTIIFISKLVPVSTNHLGYQELPLYNEGKEEGSENTKKETVIAFARIISGGFHLHTQKWLEKLELIRTQLQMRQNEEKDDEVLKREEQINSIHAEEEKIKSLLDQPLFLLGSRYNPLAPHIRCQLRDIHETYLSKYSSLSDNERQKLKLILENFDVTLITRPYEVLQLYIMMGSNYQRIDKPLTVFPHLENNWKNSENLQIPDSSKNSSYEVNKIIGAGNLIALSSLRLSKPNAIGLDSSSSINEEFTHEEYIEQGSYDFLESSILKTATLSSTLFCPSLPSISMQAKPLVRVAVEAMFARDIAALEDGLSKLYMADPAVEVSITETGEHIVSALGELHLEQCLKDLRERYGKVPFRVSPPLVHFRESCTNENFPLNHTVLSNAIPFFTSNTSKQNAKSLEETEEKPTMKVNLNMFKNGPLSSIYSPTLLESVPIMEENVRISCPKNEKNRLIYIVDDKKSETLTEKIDSDIPFQLISPPWSEEDGASTAKKGLCSLNFSYNLPSTYNSGYATENSVSQVTSDPLFISEKGKTNVHSETATNTTMMENFGAVEVRVNIRCFALSVTLTKLLEEKGTEIQQLIEEYRNYKRGSLQSIFSSLINLSQTSKSETFKGREFKEKMHLIQQVNQQMIEVYKQTAHEENKDDSKEITIDKIWSELLSLGPKACGPNILMKKLRKVKYVKESSMLSSSKLNLLSTEQEDRNNDCPAPRSSFLHVVPLQHYYGEVTKVEDLDDDDDSSDEEDSHERTNEDRKMKRRTLYIPIVVDPLPLQTKISNSCDTNQKEHFIQYDDLEQQWEAIENNLIAGFQMATSSGPIMEETLSGIGYQIEGIDLIYYPPLSGGTNLLSSLFSSKFSSASFPWLNPSDAFYRTIISSSGRLMNCMRSCCRASFLSMPVRILEPFFACDLQCDQSQLGNLYGVISKRRGKVIEEDLLEGTQTQVFLIRVHLPVAESFGFSNEVLKKTSGSGTAPQLEWSHWEIMDMDPFWRPTNDDEREEFGEDGGGLLTNTVTMTALKGKNNQDSRNDRDRDVRERTGIEHGINSGGHSTSDSDNESFIGIISAGGSGVGSSLVGPMYDNNLPRRYIDETRRRKGLPIPMNIVEKAEKQRTLTKNK